MAQWLMLDALNPPAPDQLMADMRAVGARAVAAYMLRQDASGNMLGTGTWTTAHIAAVQQSGGFVLPILVPGSNPNPSDMQVVIQASESAGIRKSAIAVDIEQFSFPAPQWLADAVTYAHLRGWKVIRYGDVGPLASYPVADGDWLSHGRIPVTANRISPIPQLPFELAADQYSVGCVINGSSYDASVIDSSVFGSLEALGLEVDTLAGSLVRAPFDGMRFDLVWADPDGAPRVKTSTGGAGGLDAADEAAIIDRDHVPASGFFSVVALWDTLDRLCYLGFGRDGAMYLAVQRLDGVFDQGWSQLANATVAVPGTGAVSTQNTVDAALRAALKGALGSL